MRNAAVLRRLAFTSFLVSTALACGSRTGLFGDDDSFGFSSSSGFSSTSSSGAIVEGGVFFDGGIIVPDDAQSTIDARPVPPDVFRADCPDADTLLIYVISDQNELMSFNPDNGQFRTISTINCLSGANVETGGPGAPFSMAVDRKGTAYVLFTDNRIYKVSTATGACASTSYKRGQNGFERFGMGFATKNIFGPQETLFVAGDSENGDGTAGFATIDTSTYNLEFIGNDTDVTRAELTGTGDGRLFAFFSDPENGPGADRRSNIGEVDTSTGLILGRRHFESVEQGDGWAFAFWGGDFYMFHAPGGRTVVTRWRPIDNSVATVATAPSGVLIVGAGVSTCAPQQ